MPKRIGEWQREQIMSYAMRVTQKRQVTFEIGAWRYSREVGTGYPILMVLSENDDSTDRAVMPLTVLNNRNIQAAHDRVTDFRDYLHDCLNDLAIFSM